MNPKVLLFICLLIYLFLKSSPRPKKLTLGPNKERENRLAKYNLKLNPTTLAKRISGPKGTLFRKAETYPDHVMHSVDITVTHIDANGTESETIFLSSPMDDDWWFQVCDSRRKVAAG